MDPHPVEAMEGEQPQARHAPGLCNRPTNNGKPCQKPPKQGHNHCHLHGRKGSGRRDGNFKCCEFADEDLSEEGAVETDVGDDEAAQEQPQLRHEPRLCNRPTAEGGPCQSPPKRDHSHCRHHGRREQNGKAAEYPNCCDFTDGDASEGGFQEEDENGSEGADREGQLEHGQIRQDNGFVSHIVPVQEKGQREDLMLINNDPSIPQRGHSPLRQHHNEVSRQSSRPNPSPSLPLQKPPHNRRRKSRSESRSPNPDRRKKSRAMSKELQEKYLKALELATKFDESNQRTVDLCEKQYQLLIAHYEGKQAELQKQLQQVKEENKDLKTTLEAAYEDASGLRKDLRDLDEVKRRELADQAKQLDDKNSAYVAQLEAELQRAHKDSEAFEERLREQERAYSVRLDQQESKLESRWDKKLETKLGEQAAGYKKNMERQENAHQEQLETLNVRARDSRAFALANDLKRHQDNHNTILAKELQRQEEELNKTHHQALIEEQEKRDRQALDLQKQAADLNAELAKSKKRIDEIQADYDQLEARRGNPKARENDVAKAKAELEKTKASIASESAKLELVKGEVAKANEELTGGMQEQSRWDSARDRVRKLVKILSSRDVERVRKELLEFLEEGEMMSSD